MLQIKYLEVSYQVEIDFEGEDINVVGKVLKLFYLQLFFMVSVQVVVVQFKFLFVYVEMGYFYVGIEKIEFLELFSFLFELDELIGDCDFFFLEVIWFYFFFERWIFFFFLVVEDGIRSFMESGIVEL